MSKEDNMNYKEKVHFTTIRNGLQKCCVQIEHMLSCVNDCNCNFLVDLLRLKQHASDFIKFLDDKNTLVEKVNNNMPQKKTSVDDGKKQELQKLIESTIEAPRIKGLEEVAGLWEPKRILKSLIILPKSQPQLFANRKTVNSILLFGPPGTGKTQLIHALAYDAGARLFSVSASDILSPFVGQSEKNLKFLFEYIRNQDGFCLLFIDEVDGFCRRRSNSEQEFSRRIKTELLCQLNKMESHSNFFLIAATNCPWDLDPAFLRRFQKRLYIPLPSYQERIDLFRLFMKNIQVDESFSTCENLISRTEGFSGSDISDLIQEVVNYPIMELEDTKIWKNSPDGFYEPITQMDECTIEEVFYSELYGLPPNSVRARKVQLTDFVNALNTIKITVTKEHIERFEKFNNNRL